MEDIFNPTYWSQRLTNVEESNLHHAIFRCDKARWLRIEQKHREILNRVLSPTDKILDAGCGWGRMVDLLPTTFKGSYVGVDLSPDFIKLAILKHAKHPLCPFFLTRDLRSLGLNTLHFNCGILISIRPMIKRHQGNEVWESIETELRKYCDKLLFLEYDELDEGSVE